MTTDEGVDRQKVWTSGARSAAYGPLIARADDTIGFARGHSILNDPAKRYQLAEVVAMREVNALNNARAKAATTQGRS